MPSGGFGQGSTLEPSFVAGSDPSAGTVRVEECFRIVDDTSVEFRIGLQDAEGNPSNLLSIVIPRPPGAN
jgi:hypothetical protein